MSSTEDKENENPNPPIVNSPTIGVNLRVTVKSNKGDRKYMEDKFSVAYYQQRADSQDLEYAYFAVFDGHGGHHAASFAKKHLMMNIIRRPDFWEEDDIKIAQAIEEGFIDTHQAMRRNVHRWPQNISGLPSTSGTTASIAFLRRSKAYIGHCGDSGIVIGRQATAEDVGSDDGTWIGENLTTEHKPDTPKELDRIKNAGGQVVEKQGVPRVVWQRPHTPSPSGSMDSIPFLAIARSLGDLWSYNDEKEEYIVSPFPDVIVYEFDLTKDKCLILATDGLFNVFTAQEVVEVVQIAETNNKNLGKGEKWINPAKFLVDCALAEFSDEGLPSDNTTALVLMLDPMVPEVHLATESPQITDCTE